MEFNPDKPCDEMHRVKEKVSVYQRERTAPMLTCLEVHKKMRNLGMSVGGMHRYCAYRTGCAQNNSPEFEGIKNQAERLTRLNQVAIQQMRILVEDRTTRKLEVE